MSWLALDIGGAHLKLADGAGFAQCVPFPLWQKHRQLPDALKSAFQAAPPFERVAVTMTGELADCFTTRSEGVQFILGATAQAAEQRKVRVYVVPSRLEKVAVAQREPLAVAAGNWHALAKFAGRYAPTGLAMLIDIGSTTIDLIPMLDGVPVSLGTTDIDRMRHGELVYSGVERTPLCALAATLPYRGEWIPISSEFFATTRDVYLTLGDLEPIPGDLNTANGKPATKSYSRDRLAHTLCTDRESFDDRDATALAEAIDRIHLARIGTAWGQVTGRFDHPVETVIFSGHGEFLARRLLERLRIRAKIVSLATELGPLVSRCAPAHALAILAREDAANRSSAKKTT